MRAEISLESLKLIMAQINNDEFQMMILHQIHKGNYPTFSVG